MSLLGVLLVVFIILKVTALIAWPWVVVLIPLWIGLGLFVLALVLAGVGALVRRKVASDHAKKSLATLERIYGGKR